MLTVKDIRVDMKVKSISKDGTRGLVGEVKALDNGLVAVAFEGGFKGHKCGCLSKNNGWWLWPEELEIISKEASTTCSPDDTFDYIIGAQIALARLAQKCGKPATVYLPTDTKDFKIEFI